MAAGGLTVYSIVDFISDPIRPRRASLHPSPTQELRTFGIGVPVGATLVERHGRGHGVQRHPPRTGSRTGDTRRGTACRGFVRRRVHRGLDRGPRRDAHGHRARSRTPRRAAGCRRRFTWRPSRHRPTRRARTATDGHRSEYRSTDRRNRRWRRVAGRSGNDRARGGRRRSIRRAVDRGGASCRTGRRPRRCHGADRHGPCQRRVARERRGRARRRRATRRPDSGSTDRRSG